MDQIPTPTSPYQRIKIGGLMRCCIHTVYTTEIKKEPKIGDKIECRYCSDRMVWTGSAWEWDRPRKGE